jgi:hypothetical protein
LRRQKNLDELDERMAEGKRAEDVSDDQEARAMGLRKEGATADETAREDALLDEEAKRMAAEFGWDGSNPPVTEEELAFLEAEREYAELMGRKSTIRGEDGDEDERWVREAARAIDASGGNEAPKVPEKDLDELTRRAEEAVIAQSVGRASGETEDEAKRNEQIMKQVNVEKGLGEDVAAKSTESTGIMRDAQEEKSTGNERPKDDAPKDDAPKE